MSTAAGKVISSAAAKATILCIDRYPSLLPTVKLLLQSLGYKALTASSVDEGLSHLSENRIDIVILDYTLCEHDHRKNGCVGDRIRAVQPNVKIVVWCADDAPSKNGSPCADVILIKPVDPRELATQLGFLLGSSTALA
jgi:DNA-binding response OmpR family regulator